MATRQSPWRRRGPHTKESEPNPTPYCARAATPNPPDTTGDAEWPGGAGISHVTKNPPANAGSIPGKGSSPGEGNGTPLQDTCLENPMDGGTWWAAVHGVAKSRTRLSDFPFTFHFHALEKAMATHSNVPAWRIPGTGEPGRLPSMGSHRVGHD